MPQNVSGPPFRYRNCAALAYVFGRYAPPGPKPGPAGFLGVYIARDDPRLCFLTFDRVGKALAFKSVPTDQLNLEYALIFGWLHYEIPFDQWRGYPVGRHEARILKALKLRGDYNESCKRLGAVLYQARINTYFSLPKSKPMFSLRPRSAASIKADTAERENVFHAVSRR